MVGIQASGPLVGSPGSATEPSGVCSPAYAAICRKQGPLDGIPLLFPMAPASVRATTSPNLAPEHGPKEIAVTRTSGSRRSTTLSAGNGGTTQSPTCGGAGNSITVPDPAIRRPLIIGTTVTATTVTTSRTTPASGRFMTATVTSPRPGYPAN